MKRYQRRVKRKMHLPLLSMAGFNLREVPEAASSLRAGRLVSMEFLVSIVIRDAVCIEDNTGKSKQPMVNPRNNGKSKQHR